MKNLINKIKKNKTTAIIYTFTIVLLAFIVISVTYAYFEAQSLAAGIGNVNAKFSTLDEYLITSNGNLNLAVTPTTLPENGNNQVVTATAQVSLKRNPDTTNTATRSYYVYLKIKNNTFTRTSASRPEILFNAYLNNQEVTITDLTQVTEGLVTGYDVTEESGLIEIVAPQTITSSSSDTATVQNWEFKLTYLNLDIDQSANIGASFNAEVMINKEEYQGFTGTLYRLNNRTAFNNHEINDETSNVWCHIYGGAPDCSYPYATKVACEYWDFYTCSEGTATIGVGDYETDADDIRNIENVYCAYYSANGNNSCNNGYYFDTQTQCEDYLTTNNISGYTCIEGSVNNIIYLKHEVLDGFIEDSKVCLWYNNHEFCMGPNYWVETGNGGTNHQSEENGIATKNKLQAEMEAALGVQADLYYGSPESANFSFQYVTCDAYSSGKVSCNDLHSNKSCQVYSDGSSNCNM